MGSPSILMVGESLAGRYELEELVGVGGMAHVYRARDLNLDRTVAVKVLDDRIAAEADAVERFQREARMAAGLAHENIVAVIDRGDDNGRPFIVFEYFAGITLKQLVRTSGPLPIERALGLALQVARGLVFAHASGYVHRDVKPHNVLVDRDGRVKLTDFGIARSLEATEGSTVTGTVMGSADYIPPEQAQARQVDERSDIYSLGVVLFELLTGELPFTGESFVAVALQHVNAPPPSVRARRAAVSSRLDAAVSKALSKSPERRFASMEAFAAELEGCLRDAARDGDEADRTLVIPGAPASRTARKAPLVVVGAVLLALGLGVAAVLLVPGSSTPVREGVPKASAAAVTSLVRLRAASAYDPRRAMGWRTTRAWRSPPTASRRRRGRRSGMRALASGT